MKASIEVLMSQSGVAFGTSGARGLADAMTDFVGYMYTRGFLQYLVAIGELRTPGTRVIVGGDFRPSTDRIMRAVFRAVSDMGYRPVNSGKVPSPAVALLGFEEGLPSIMVTGSHIPDDRNGIKFNKVSGEILKSDEAGMRAQEIEWDDGGFDARGGFVRPDVPSPAVSDEARERYVRRYLEAFPDRPLAGVRLGVYQHSAVGRDVIVEILSGLGAETDALGRSERFIPVDTEAIRPEDVEVARQWGGSGRYDALVSADGDSDRPLVSDERGEWLRGDVAGILCARFLGADSVTTPVSSNTAVERCGWFPEVRRTRIGSPHVAASMTAAVKAGHRKVVGYEANGGFLIQTDLAPRGRLLRALPTRDAVIVMLGVLLLAKQESRSVSELVASLPPRFTASDRLGSFPVEKSRAILERFSGEDEAAVQARMNAAFGELVGASVATVDRTDGVRMVFDNAEILHLRPSGNAPEFRCYSEAGTAERAKALCERALWLLNHGR